MSNKKHTPGPWKCEMLATGQHGVFTEIYNDQIALIRLRSGFDESNANARLIAAAPEMYDMLKELSGIISATIAPIKELEQLLTRIEDETA